MIRASHYVSIEIGWNCLKYAVKSFVLQHCFNAFWHVSCQLLAEVRSDFLPLDPVYQVCLWCRIMRSYFLLHNQPHILYNVQIGTASRPWFEQFILLLSQWCLNRSRSMTRCPILLMNFFWIMEILASFWQRLKLFSSPASSVLRRFAATSSIGTKA